MLLLAPSISDWLPEDHRGRFVVEVTESLDLTPILAKYARRPRGCASYHLAILVSLLFCGCATGAMGSRKIETAI